MDILGRYEQQHPQAAAPTRTDISSDDYGFFINLVMRLSGGRIRDANQASSVLLGAVVVMIIIAVIILVIGMRSGAVPLTPVSAT